VSDRTRQTWFRHTVFAGAVVVTSAVAIGATPGPAAAQLYPGYSRQFNGHPYHQHDGWVSDRRGWHRGWSEHGRGHGEWAPGIGITPAEATGVIRAGAAVARVAGVPSTTEQVLPPAGMLEPTSARLAHITDSHG
jgi:hypothetical protein